jgi:cyclic-di-GMP-binding protein
VKNSFFLVIPAQEAKPERLKEFEPKALAQWLFELPTANPGLATRLIQEFIIDMNAIKMPLQLRLDALEQIRPKVLIIEDYLRSRLIKAAFPKEENDLKVLNVLTSIERELTIGYWMILKELTHRQISWFQGKNLVLTLQRCIKGLSSVVISHYLMGLPIPDFVWIDLHSLFKLSVKLKKDNVKVSDITGLLNKESSPEECYRQILLLSLSKPTGLMQKEILQVYDFIGELFQLFNLVTEPVESQRYQFIVMMDDDKAPFVQMDLYAQKNTLTMYLDLSRLSKALEKKEKYINPSQTRFASIHLKNQEEKPTLELLEYLEQRWLGFDLQQESMFSDRLDRYIALGLAPAHNLQMPGHDKTWAGSDAEQEILAHSESERLLFCILEKTGILSVGNLISIRRADQPITNRSLAVINELIVTKQSSKVSFGIKLITKRYHAVYYMMANASATDTPLKGLFYNDDEQIEDTSFLVVDNFMLKDGDLIKMQMNEEHISLVLKAKKNIALGYWQFECNRVATNIDTGSKSSKKGYDFI